MKNADHKQDLEEIFCNEKELGELLCLSSRRIRQLVEEGVIPKAGRNRYNLVAALKAYHAKANRQAKDPEQEDLKLRLLKARTIEREAKARKAKYQADAMEGKLIPLEEIEQEMGRTYIELKAAMLTLPRQISFRITDPNARIVIEEELDAFIYETLDQWSERGMGSCVAPDDWKRACREIAAGYFGRCEDEKLG